MRLQILFPGVCSFSILFVYVESLKKDSTGIILCWVLDDKTTTMTVKFIKYVYNNPYEYNNM